MGNDTEQRQAVRLSVYVSTTCHGNKSLAARNLGIAPMTLARWLKGKTPSRVMVRDMASKGVDITKQFQSVPRPKE